jgi:hypothetical protein
MTSSLRRAQTSTLLAVAELAQHGVEVYVPCVDDQRNIVVARIADRHAVRHVDIHVKVLVGENPVFGVRVPATDTDDFVLVLHQRGPGEPEHLFYLSAEQVRRHQNPDTQLGELRQSRQEREQYLHQTMEDLARFLGIRREVLSARGIQRAALGYTTERLGMAIRVGTPRQEDDEWVVELFSRDEKETLGWLYLTAHGEVIPSKSATFDTVRDHRAARTEAPAA